jgi:hypothetical protein
MPVALCRSMIAMSSLCNSIWIEMMANTFPLMQIEVYKTFILFTGNDFQSLIPLTTIFFFSFEATQRKVFL